MGPGLYALGGLFALDIVLQALAGPPRLGQVLLVGETLRGLIVAGWMLGHLRRAPGATSEAVRDICSCAWAPRALRAHVARPGWWPAASAMDVWRICMTSGILAGGVLALTLAASVRVCTGVLAYALRVWPLRALHLVQHHHARLERRLARGLVWLAVLGWVIRSLSDVGLWEPVLALGSTVLTATLERGTIRLSVGDVLAFGLTVLGASLLSTFLRFVLDEDIYPRTGITTGQAYAVSTLLHYGLLALGFLGGLGLLGMDMTRVTVLVGALGVGIGFGVQSVVNNWLSGLILLFERPIQVGDAVELGALQGVVRRIGLRASVVHT